MGFLQVLSMPTLNLALARALATLKAGTAAAAAARSLGAGDNSLRYSYGLEQVLHGIAYRLGEVHELHGDLGRLLSEIVCKEGAYAACTCIYFNLYVTLDC